MLIRRALRDGGETYSEVNNGMMILVLGSQENSYGNFKSGKNSTTETILILTRWLLTFKGKILAQLCLLAIKRLDNAYSWTC